MTLYGAILKHYDQNRMFEFANDSRLRFYSQKLQTQLKLVTLDICLYSVEELSRLVFEQRILDADFYNVTYMVTNIKLFLVLLPQRIVLIFFYESKLSLKKVYICFFFGDIQAPLLSCSHML